MEYYANLGGETCDCLIDTVIDHFLCEVIRPAGVGIHARSFSDRFEARQYFNRSRIVLIFQKSIYLYTEFLNCAGL